MSRKFASYDPLTRYWVRVGQELIDVYATDPDSARDLVEADGKVVDGVQIAAGHWPAGIKRNQGVKPPRGYKDVATFIDEVQSFCLETRGAKGRPGRTKSLSQHLGITPQSTRKYLCGQRHPGQHRVDGIWAWYRKARRETE